MKYSAIAGRTVILIERPADGRYLLPPASHPGAFEPRLTSGPLRSAPVAFLDWLGHIHHDTTLFDNEVKNGTDTELKTYAKNSITAGNEHLKEAHELLAKLKK